MIPHCIYCDQERPLESKACPSCGVPLTFGQARADLAFAVAGIKNDIDKALTLPFQRRIQAIIWRIAGVVGRVLYRQ